MLSLQDCVAMADIPDDKFLELAKREHLPVMLAVALAAQRRNELVQQDSAETGAPVWRGDDVSSYAAQPQRAEPTPK